MSRDEALRIVEELRREFPASSYDLMSRNCNTFSDALCKRLCNGQGIPSWVNRLAGVGGALRSAVGAAPDASAASAKAEGGAGGPAAAGLVARTAAADGGLNCEVEWAGVGVLNASGDDATAGLRGGSAISSEDGPELLLLLPFNSPVKMQALHLEAPSAEAAPAKVRLFANQRNLDMDDAGGGVVPTQEAALAWSVPRADGTVAAVVEVNFLRFQNLGFLAVHFSREDEDGPPITVQGLRLVGRV
eukprot:NODE_14808_length_1084_cov_6.211076.p2 GENE.NODE_14808_length_1084_cov_6.211076~~NODE_14808_length_1084_cov_6.211076.p2  ORF type:complete len:277 (+),score=100.32 NODE_14808_length_1084_cov_6.211076:96-833(+)